MTVNNRNNFGTSPERTAHAATRPLKRAPSIFRAGSRWRVAWEEVDGARRIVNIATHTDAVALVKKLSARVRKAGA